MASHAGNRGSTPRGTTKCFSFLDASEQLVGDAWVFEPHDTLFRTAEAQEIDTSVSDDLLIKDRKVMMDVGFVYDLDISCTK